MGIGLCSGQSLTDATPGLFDSPHNRHGVVPNNTSLNSDGICAAKEYQRPCTPLVCVFMARCCTFAKVADIMDYEAAVSFSLENSSTQHDVVAGAIGGPVAPRLDRLIRRGENEWGWRGVGAENEHGFIFVRPGLTGCETGISECTCAPQHSYRLWPCPASGLALLPLPCRPSPYLALSPSPAFACFV